jgi:hypothetical protein
LAWWRPAARILAVGGSFRIGVDSFAVQSALAAFHSSDSITSMPST